MKKRIPVDIQFLLESILNETPDRITISKNDKKKFDKLGIDSKIGTTYHYDNDARAFFLAKEDVVIYSNAGNTHGVMENAIRTVVFYAKSSMSFANKAVFVKDSSGVGIKSKMTSGIIYFHGLLANDLEDIRKYLFKHNSYFRNLEIRGYSEDKEAVELAGRIWIQKNMISFWNTRDEWKKYMPVIFEFMDSMDMNSKKAIYEFIDSRNFWTYGELSGQEPEAEKEKLSPEEIKKLQAAQHLDAKAKEKLFGPEYKDLHKQKAAKGFDFPAQADATLPALEGHIKLKDLLKENPDKVDLKGGSGGDMKIARYQDNDAVAFFAFPNFAAYYEGGTHTDIISVLYNVYGELKLKITKYADDLKIEGSLDDAYSFVKDYMKKHDVHVTNFDGMVKDLQSGPLKNFFDNENIHNDDDPGGFRTKSGGLGGRLWSRKKIISFWNVREDVIRKWNMVEQLFSQSAGKFGKLSDYKVDWLERDIREMPMTPADEVSSSSGSEDNQMDFLEKLSGDAPISPEELKKLQGELHLMSAKEKKEALLKLGYKNKKYEERAAIADKLGMTVAEFNSIMNVNEEVS